MKKILISLMIAMILFVVSCGGDDTEDTAKNFPNKHDGLNWSDASNYDKYWEDAVTYCEDLDGRLPTISELRTLIQNCPATETGGECGVTDSCLSSDCWNESSCYSCSKSDDGKYSVFGDIRCFWSSSEHSDSTDRAGYVCFINGFVYYRFKHYKLYVRCVK